MNQLFNLTALFHHCFVVVVVVVVVVVAVTMLSTRPQLQHYYALASAPIILLRLKISIFKLE